MCALVTDDDADLLPADSPRRARVLVAIAFRDPAITRIGRDICKQLASDGHIAELGNVDANAMPAPPDYDMIVIGMTGGRFRDRNMRRWLGLYRSVLVDIPSALFVVASPGVLGRTVTRVLRGVALLPIIVDVFARDDELVAAEFASRVGRAVHGPAPGSDLAHV